MGFGWKEVVPSDPYIVRLARPLSPGELSYITQLYQPLIGPLSVSLYITFFHEHCADENLHSNHRILMSTMESPLNEIVKARQTLEAIGLLRTVKISTEQGDQLFEYSLQPPLAPLSFFGDDMLSMILLGRVGKSRYSYLREKFVGIRTEIEQGGIREDITKSFDDIFRSITPSELMAARGSETDNFLLEMESRFPTKGAGRSGEVVISNQIQLKQDEPDFVFLEATLPKTLGKSRQLKPEVRQVLKEMSFYYQLDDMQLSYFLQEPIIYDDYNEIDPGRLKWVIKDWYLRTHQGQQPHVQHKVAEQHEQVQVKSEQSREEEHKQALCTLSPIALLEHYQGGGKAAPADLKIIDELAGQYKLTPGVINVLLEYVMITNNKQLPKSLILKIASHWKRLGIDTVDQALEQAKHLHNEMKPKPKPRKDSSVNRPSAKNAMKKDELPEWVARQMEHKEKPNAPQQEEVDETKKKEIAELLKALGEID